MKALAYGAEIFALAMLAPFIRALRFCGVRGRGVAIVGWWGSETAGDVAILGQLLRECRDVAPEAPIAVVTFDMAITRRSLADLEATHVALVPVGLRSAWLLATSLCMVVGGGPLMESPSMKVWACSARLARAAGARVLCYANGIGPVRTERSAHAITTLARAATHVILRDEASRVWLARREPDIAATVTFDPAFELVRERVGRAPPHRRAQLALALRAPPAAYLGDLDKARAAEGFLDVVATALNALLQKYPVTLVGVVMHDGTGDSNDHAMYARLRARLTLPQSLEVRPGHHTIGDAIRDIAESRAALTVRFHAMIIALASGTPFVAVDYARPDGKVSGAAALVGRESDVVTWDSLRSEDLTRRLQILYESAPMPVPDLETTRQRRLAVLRDALQSPERAVRAL